MADIRPFIEAYLLEPLKRYPTTIQDTIVETIVQKLQLLYNYSVEFPEIITPNQNRLDILKAISDQFLFTIREEADLQEQLDILNNILHVYRKRGSVDTIENMWKYYGGDLPNNVRVIIPSYNLFRYSISKLSGKHSYAKGLISYVELDTPSEIDIDISDGLLAIATGSDRYRAVTNLNKGSYQLSLANVEGLNKGEEISIGNLYKGKIVNIVDDRTNLTRSGMYEIKLINNTYSIPALREFLIKELVAAGNYIYFTNEMSLDLTSQVNPGSHFNYIVIGGEEDTNFTKFVEIQMPILKDNYSLITLKDGRLPVSRGDNGLTWSGRNFMSPSPSLNFVEINNNFRDTLGYDMFDLDDIKNMTSYRDANDSLLSGKPYIYLELVKSYELSEAVFDEATGKYNYTHIRIYPDSYDSISSVVSALDPDVPMKMKVRDLWRDLVINSEVYYTPRDIEVSSWSHLYKKNENNEWELLDNPYSGYFVLGTSLLGKEHI